MTLGREKWKSGWDDATLASEIAISHFNRSLELIEEDSRSFDLLMDAYKLPKNSEDENAIRSNAIKQATIHAAEVPLETAKCALEVMRNLPNLATSGIKNAVSDVGVAALLGSAACKGALFNVEINLSSLDHDDAPEIFTESEIIKVEIKELARACMHAVRKRLDS